ncbi:hypothetical protein [Candidatus Villigracilis affinis]|uniref:hypothetical protein n=1 Tax=Candidatus Villigracilis affinis TaxID=3140682 RepID=UPI001DD553CB|nr:hypothetical protein [Anaerolineales bacterium]
MRTLFILQICSTPPSQSQRAIDIQCGVAVTAIDNLLKASWDKLQVYSSEQLQKYFAGLFHFSQFVLDVEISIGRFISSEHLDWAGNELARKEFGFISHFRVHLDKFASEFRELQDFGTTGRWIIVEGDAEKAFIERLGELRFNTIYVSGVEKYGGKTNATSTRFKLYVESLKSRGYLVSIQGDRDNSTKNRLEQIANDGLVEKELIFPFSKDFEGGFPPSVLHKALNLTGYDVSLEWLADKMSQPSHPPIIGIVESKIGKQINKIELARSLANVMEYNWRNIFENNGDNEIVKWLTFLRTGDAP